MVLEKLLDTSFAKQWLPLVDLGVKARGKDLVATVVLDKLRRRLRQNGYRAHLTLQVQASPLLLYFMFQGATVSGGPKSAGKATERTSRARFRL